MSLKVIVLLIRIHFFATTPKQIFMTSYTHINSEIINNIKFLISWLFYRSFTSSEKVQNCLTSQTIQSIIEKPAYI
jgi:hypothetical protein